MNNGAKESMQSHNNGNRCMKSSGQISCMAEERQGVTGEIPIHSYIAEDAMGLSRYRFKHRRQLAISEETLMQIQ
jgi:hypothetical protein